MIARGPEIHEVAKSNNQQTKENIGKDTNVVEAVKPNETQINKEENKNLTTEQAQVESKGIVESVESKGDIQMLNEIIKAFNEDKDGKLTNLRFEYNALTNKIMASYNAEIKKVLKDSNDGDNKEGMENKESRESSSVESEEKTGDFSETDIININKNPEWAKYVSDKIMEPPQDKLLNEISDINEVLKKGSEDDKKILNETISKVQNAITNLYHAAGLDKK